MVVEEQTGYSEYWKVKNIYDLAGNVWEFTNELYTSNRVYRGGSTHDSGSFLSLACRNSGDPLSFHGNVGFRVALYIL